MVLSIIMQLLQNEPDYPPQESPGNTLYDQIPGFGNSLIFIIIILVIWVVSAIILAYWVHRDLRKREVQGYSYIILTLILGIIGFIIYYLIRYNEKCALEAQEDACLLSDEDESFPSTEEII